MSTPQVDVDSYDCALVWELLKRFHHRPSCILLEVNSAFPPPFEFAMEPHSAWDSLDPKLVRYHLAHGCLDAVHSHGHKYLSP